MSRASESPGRIPGRVWGSYFENQVGKLTFFSGKKKGAELRGSKGAAGRSTLPEAYPLLPPCYKAAYDSIAQYKSSVPEAGRGEMGGPRLRPS